jgi:hypothetical protein
MCTYFALNLPYLSPMNNMVVSPMNNMVVSPMNNMVVSPMNNMVVGIEIHYSRYLLRCLKKPKSRGRDREGGQINNTK